MPATAAMSGHSSRIVPTATAAPTSWAATKAATEAGAMPAKVFENIRATVTAGLAKLVDDVNQYAPVMYAPTAKGTVAVRPLRTTPKMTSSSPKVATTSPSHRLDELRACSEMLTAGSENMRLASITPTTAPETWAARYAPSSRHRRPPKIASTTLTAGLRWAPETEPTARMIATSAAPVASAFSRSSMPVSCGLRRWAAMPEPTTAISSNAVPMNSAVARRRGPIPG